MGEAMLQMEASCHKYQALDNSAKWHLEACHYLQNACKFPPLKEPQAVRQLGVARSHGVTRLMQTQTWLCGGEVSPQERRYQPVDYVGGGLNTVTIVTAPPALTLKPHSSVFPCMSLAPLSHFHSTGAQVSE